MGTFTAILFGWMVASIAFGETEIPCCVEKEVGGMKYTLLHVDNGATKAYYNCKNNCVYTIHEGGRYCFRVGDKVSKCMDSQVSDEALGHSSTFHAFKMKHGKVYANSIEELLRQRIWTENVAFIKKHNQEYNNGLHSFRVGENKFADYTAEEYRKRLGFVPGSNKTRNVRKLDNVGDMPSYWNWTEKGAVTPVKDQGECGGCWAFSTTGSLEGAHFNATGKLVSLSQQNLLDCVSNNSGCGGGSVDNGFKYIKKNGGINTQANYPYIGITGSCNYNNSSENVGATLTHWWDTEPGDEKALQNAVYAVGPVSVVVDANSPSFQQYRSGVYRNPTCSSARKILNHAVLVVGFGTDDHGTDYWIVKNHWGEDWGMNGYMNMIRNNDNNCGIATEASYPVV